MRLFIGALAYGGDEHGETFLRIGVLTGSLASLVLSCILFAFGRKPSPPAG
jgi:Na+/H+ antiporter NhaA